MMMSVLCKRWTAVADRMVFAHSRLAHAVDLEVVVESDRLESQVLQEVLAVEAVTPFSRLIVVFEQVQVQVFQQLQVILSWH